jgi:hypothetical protein
MGYVSGILTDPKYAGADSAGSLKKGTELDKNAFLNLLIAQLKNQDPLNPMKDQEFIAQLATFSSLEQMGNMNKNMESQGCGYRYERGCGLYSTVDRRQWQINDCNQGY